MSLIITSPPLLDWQINLSSSKLFINRTFNAFNAFKQDNENCDIRRGHALIRKDKKILIISSAASWREKIFFFDSKFKIEKLKMIATKFCPIIAFVFVCFHPALGATPEIVQSVITKTDDCFQCGMIEGFGYLNVKVNFFRILGFFLFFVFWLLPFLFFSWGMPILCSYK